MNSCRKKTHNINYNKTTKTNLLVISLVVFIKDILKLKKLEYFSWLKATPQWAEGIVQQLLQFQRLALQAGHAGSHDLIHQQQV